MPTPLDRYEATVVVAPNTIVNGVQVADTNDIQTAINMLPSQGGKIFVKAGRYPILNTLRIEASNVQIQGEGMGITNIIVRQSMLAAPALEVYSSGIGSALPLTADTRRGDTAIALSAANAATLAVGDYILVYSNKSVDSEEPAKHAGEVKQVATVDPATGHISLNDQLCDTYLLANAASVIRVTILRNITLSDLSITTTATSSNLTVGFTHFRFVDNLQIERVESYHAYHSGIHLQSVLNSRISDCYIHDIRDVQPTGQNARYGIVVGSASQNVSINGCRFAQTRHAVTTGGSSGTNQNGVQRNVTVSNCTSMLSDTAHFDTHEPAENVTFIGCAAIGGIPAKDVVVGFQMRARNSSIIGCSVLQAVGKGIMIFGKVSSGATITGNMISNVAAITGAEGIGIFLDANGTSGHVITGNTIKNCEGSGIVGSGANNDIVISGNAITGSNSVVPGASISFTNATRVLLTGNKIMNNATGRAIAMGANCSDWHIAANAMVNNNDNGLGLSDVRTVVLNNQGYNPVGPISSPWALNGDLTNEVSGGSADPVSGKVYQARHSPKTVTVAGGDVSGIAINGSPAGVTAGAFKLGIAETIAITYSGTAPSTRLFAE